LGYIKKLFKIGEKYMFFDYQPPQDNHHMDYKKPPYHICAYVEEDNSPFLKDGKLNNTYLKKCAEELKTLFNDGFQWSDLGKIISMSNEAVIKQPLTAEQKKAAIVGIFDNLIDITDTPYLPDKIFDPVFKRMIPNFVNLIATDVFFFIDPVEGKPSEKTMLQYAKKVKNILSDGFQWSDIPKVTYLALDFANSFVSLDKAEKAKLAKYVIDYGLDHTSILFIGDDFVDEILKSITHSVIDEFFNK
jgi:hypothetical protein